MTVIDPNRSLADLALERVLDRTGEAALSRLGSSGFSSGTGRAGGVPATVTGLAVDGTRGNLTITWNAVEFKPRPRYRVEISTSQAFTNATVINTYNTELMWTKDIDESTTYYARVRAEGGSNAGQLGPFSVTINATTGEIVPDGSITTAKMADDAVTTEKMADNAASVTAATSTSGTTTTGGAGTTTTIQSATITADGVTAVFIYCFANFSSKTSTPTFGAIISRGTTQIFPTVGSIIHNSTPPTAVTLAYSEVPSSGTHTYNFRIVQSGAGSGTYNGRTVLLTMAKR